MSDDLLWFKSGYSDSGGGECVEIALDWHKSRHSDAGGGDCVEVATTPTTVHIRDSKNPDGPRLHIAATAWADFLAFAVR
ncbi:MULTISPECIES: DUF397 domain-containing protein [Streptomyces violaceusniger group]|uniref:DUF397 domain-containing protein n=2 Tax=Streptomyces rhizosphaericus TaxID=114699 RepID=A0ABN1S0M1_9ACTN|nr:MULTISPECIES: DUF397 domain-containing protein [Streptomyces violaceusniger group]